MKERVLKRGEQRYGPPEALTDQQFHYCPGCTHGIVHRLIAEVIDELELREETIGVAPVGCGVLAYEYFDFDMLEAAHGRAPAVATGVKRVHPESNVFVYQGDGDFAAIGTAESVHAAARGEKITAIFINNAIYGMTGGQMAPTTLPDQITATTPRGRRAAETGHPLKITEMLSTLPGVAYVARVAPVSPRRIAGARKVIRRAFELQQKKAGFTLVEVVATCPTNWGLSPQEAVRWVEEEMLSTYPTGVIKDLEGEADDDS